MNTTAIIFAAMLVGSAEPVGPPPTLTHTGVIEVFDNSIVTGEIVQVPTADSTEPNPVVMAYADRINEQYRPLWDALANFNAG